jgi:hypothetical protein
LKIVRAYFRPAEAGEQEHATKNFIGLSTTYFDVELANGSKIRFRRAGNIRYSPASLARKVSEGNRDLGLGRMPQEPYYRLLFYSYLVPKKHSRSAAIIGTASASRLDKLDQELRAHSDEGCKSAAAGGLTCFDFDGFVTLTAQIKVELNGKAEFIDWGTKLKEVLPKNSDVKVLKSLRIQRRFMDSYYDVRFDPGDSNLLLLALVGGDRLSWSKSLRAAE